MQTAEDCICSVYVPVPLCLHSCGCIYTHEDMQRCEPARSCTGTAVCTFVHMYVHSLVAPCGHAATHVHRAVQPVIAWLSTARGTQTSSAGVLALSTCACLICRRTCSTEHPPPPSRSPRRRCAAADAQDGNSLCPCTALETQHCPEPWASCIPLSTLCLSQSPLVFSVLTRP